MGIPAKADRTAQALQLRTKAREHKRLAQQHRRKARELMRQADLVEAGIDIH